MRSNSAQKVKLTSYDDLFGKPEIPTGETLLSIPLCELHPFKNHPFRVLDDEKMLETVESVKEYGILVPGIVRNRPEGGYEVISGHRRWRACELAGLEEMPAIVRDLDDDAATVVMVDANIQREDILPSEKARAYRMKYEALKHQGSRGEKNTADMVGEAAGDSGRTVHRYIRLAELVPELLDYVDQGRVTMLAGERLSYLGWEEQRTVVEAIQCGSALPSKDQAEELKNLSQAEALSAEQIAGILEKKKGASGSVTLTAKKISQFFPPAYTKEQIENIIYGLLEQWKKEQRW
ncbi:MAG: ParB/RepB/Spo0J family partition protein [Lachnospiraceae bacterium]|nr:ParB/RepB/Spo0J family partition protein [Lachnospiraceae bacterium]